MARTAPDQQQRDTRDTALEFDVEENRIDDQSPDQEPLLGQEATTAEPSRSFELAERSSSSLPRHPVWRKSDESVQVPGKRLSSKSMMYRLNTNQL